MASDRLYYEDILTVAEEIRNRKTAIRESLPEHHRAILDATLCIVHPDTEIGELRQTLQAFSIPLRESIFVPVGTLLFVDERKATMLTRQWRYFR